MRRLPKYLKKILSHTNEIVAEGLQHAIVEHDGWCSIWKGGMCDCNPTVRFTKEWPEK